MSTFVTLFIYLMLIGYAFAQAHTYEQQIRDLKSQLIQAKQDNRKLYRLRNVILTHKKK